jgi:hypothetical protein
MAIIHVVQFQFKPTASPEVVKDVCPEAPPIPVPILTQADMYPHAQSQGELHPPYNAKNLYQGFRRGKGQLDRGTAGT